MSEIYQNRMLLTSTRDRKEGWTLVSGLWSPFYIQLRLLGSFPKTMRKVGQAMTALLKEAAPEVNKIVGVAFAGIPIATAISLESGLPALHTRKMVGVKSQEDLVEAISKYGQHELLEGVLEEGDVLCIIDDLVTGMTSKLVARDQILAEAKRRGINKIECKDIAVIIDRQQGAEEKAKESGLRLHSLIRFVDEGLLLLKPFMTPQEYDTIISYLDNHSHFQTEATD
ncbi:MAG: orotate phosphoribosyltransferase [Promethearchaeota archaeon]